MLENRLGTIVNKAIVDGNFGPASDEEFVEWIRSKKNDGTESGGNSAPKAPTSGNLAPATPATGSAVSAAPVDSGPKASAQIDLDQNSPRGWNFTPAVGIPPTVMDFEDIGDPIPTASSTKRTRSPSRTHAASGKLYMQNMMRINLLRPITTVPTITSATRIIK
jgi:hypothetical protein